MLLVRIIKKYGIILSRHQKVRIAELVILMIIAGFLEMFSVSLILPFMNAVMDASKVMSHPIASAICGLLGIETERGFLTFLATVMALLYILKNLYLMAEFNVQYRFVYANMFDLQKKLLNILLNRPYEYFLKINSGEIIRIITIDTQNTFSLLTTLLLFFSEMIVSTMLVIYIFAVTPVITLFISGIMVVLLLIITRIIKPIMAAAGKSQQKTAANMNMWLLQSINGIKEIKVMHKESFFQENYDYNGSIYINSMRKNQVLSTMPRFVIEGVCMGAMFIVIALMIANGEKLNSIIPILSSVAMAAVRLLPSVNRISDALGRIAFNEPFVDKMIENLENISSEDSGQITQTEADGEASANIPRLRKSLSFNHICYRYPDAEENVIKDASFSVKYGEAVGLIGASGAGKSTSVDIILGLLDPQVGEILVDGVDIHNNKVGWISQIGYIPQMIFMMDASIRDNVAFGVKPEEISYEDVWRALKEASLDEFVKTLPDGLDTQIGEHGVRLSGGQRQRIGIARALYNDPDILIFDEATSALDNETESSIMDAVYHLNGKKTMIIIAHRLTTIESCSHVYEVKNGSMELVR